MENNIVEFQDQKYIWQDIEGKGRCLVPYKQKITDINNNTVVKAKNGTTAKIYLILDGMDFNVVDRDGCVYGICYEGDNAISILRVKSKLIEWLNEKEFEVVK